MSYLLNLIMRALAVALLVSPASGNGRKPETLPTRDAVDGIFAHLVDGQSPGVAVMVRRHGRTLLQRGYGVRDLRTHAPIDAQANFRLASCTKQFTAMAVMLLVHDRKLRYDERLTDVFAEFPAYGSSITIRNLLNHTSGLPDYEDLMEHASSAAAPGWSETRQIQDDEVLTLLKAESRGKFVPGTQWSYSNSGYVVLGLVVARISGESFAAFLRHRIFNPLGMKHTAAYIKGANEIARRAYGHSKTAGALRETDQSSTSATLGDGGVYSNLADLALWDDALKRHTLLSAREMQPGLTPVKLADGSQPHWASGPGDSDPQAGKPVSYGFGWFLDPYKGHARMWHYGDTIGFKTGIARFPEEGLTIIVLGNRSDLDPAALMSKLADLYLSSRQ